MRPNIVTVRHGQFDGFEASEPGVVSAGGRAVFALVRSHTTRLILAIRSAGWSRRRGRDRTRLRIEALRSAHLGSL